MQIFLTDQIHVHILYLISLRPLTFSLIFLPTNYPYILAILPSLEPSSPTQTPQGSTIHVLSQALCIVLQHLSYKIPYDTILLYYCLIYLSYNSTFCVLIIPKLLSLLGAGTIQTYIHFKQSQLGSQSHSVIL